jgi:predicted amino acid-binding ACT domain protein
MLIEVEVPPFVDTGKLQEDLRKIGNEIGVRVSVKQKDDARF